MAVFEKVQEIIVEELGKDASEVTLESTFDDLLTKFMKESNERLDSIRQRENKKFSKKRKYN